MANPFTSKTASYGQMMPGEWDIEARNIERSRRLAEALQAKADADLQGQMVSGIYVKPSILQGIAKLGNGWLADKKLEEADKREIALGQKINADRAEALRQWKQAATGTPAEVLPPDVAGPARPAVEPNPQAAYEVLMSSKHPDLQELGKHQMLKQMEQEQLSQTLSKLYGGGSTTNSTASGTQSGGGSQSVSNGFGLPPKDLLLAAGNPSMPKVIGELLLKGYEPTEVEKLARVAGVSPADYARAKLTKEGTQSFQPGQMNIVPGGQRIVAPDFKEGTAGGFDAAGNPYVSTIPGAPQARATMKYAEEYPKAVLDPYKVEPRNGPPVLTNRAAAAGVPNGPGAANGTAYGVPNGPLDGGWNVPGATQSQRDKTAGQLRVDEFGSEGVRANIADIDKELGNKKLAPTARKILEGERARLVAGLSEQSMPGIPLKDEGQTKVQNAVDQQRLEALTKEAAGQQNMTNLIGVARNLISNGVLGNGPMDRVAMAAHEAGVRQTPQTVNTARLRELGNQFVLARGSLGAGVSVSDADRYDKAAGDFTKAKSLADMTSSLAIMEEIANKYINQTNTALRQYRGSGSLPDFKSGAGGGNNIDALLKKYGGR